MTSRFFPGPFLAFVCLAAGLAGRASAAAATPETPRELPVVVVESLHHGFASQDEFNRIDLAFTRVAAQRKWPVKVKVERFAANLPDRDPELRVFMRGVREEVPGELTFYAWMILTDHGTKTDFGVVQYRYHPRLGENREDVLEHVFRGAAGVAADKIEPLLFPKPAAPKT